MKKLLCLLFAVFVCGYLFAQTEEVTIVEVVEEEVTDPDEPLSVAEVMPLFLYKDNIDTRESFKSYVADSLRIPQPTCSGKVYVQFVVERDSTVDNVQILRGIGECDGYEAEVKRFFSSMPRWIPGRQGGEAVRVRLVMPVEFTPKQ